MENTIPFLKDLGEWNWLIIGGVLMGLEILVPGVYLVWFGLSALVVGSLALGFGIAWQFQMAIFAGLSLVAVVIAKRYFHDKSEESDKPLLNQRAEQNIGRSFPLTRPIVNGRGRVQIADSSWLVEGVDCDEGAMVKVVSVEGTTLKVEPA